MGGAHSSGETPVFRGGAPMQMQQQFMSLLWGQGTFPAILSSQAGKLPHLWFVGEVTLGEDSSS